MSACFSWCIARKEHRIHLIKERMGLSNVIAMISGNYYVIITSFLRHHYSKEAKVQLARFTHLLKLQFSRGRLDGDKILFIPFIYILLCLINLHHKNAIKIFRQAVL